MSTIAEIKEALGRLSPDEYYEIADWVAEHAPAETPENLARIQRQLDAVDPTKAREWSKEDWAKLGVKL